MKILKLLIVANNSPWSTWPSEIAALKKWFVSKVDFAVDLKHTAYDNIPFTASSYEQPGQTGYQGIERSWYDRNVSALAAGYDIVLFVVPVRQWLGLKARGWRTDRDQGPIELQISCDEKERIYLNGADTGSTFLQYGRHEICHALFMITGQKDTTHYWWDRNQLENALAEIQFPEPKVADNAFTFSDEVRRWLAEIVAWINGGFKTAQPKIPDELLPLQPPPAKKPSVKTFCLAIQEHEGWGGPGSTVAGVYYPNGTRSFRNKNPGNLRYVGQFRAIGADNQNFCIFKTYDDGFLTLKEMIIRAKNGLSTAYKPTMSFTDFFRTYAPSFDSNNPERYAEFVAQKCGVPASTLIKELSDT